MRESKLQDIRATLEQKQQRGELSLEGEKPHIFSAFDPDQVSPIPSNRGVDFYVAPNPPIKKEKALTDFVKGLASEVDPQGDSLSSIQEAYRPGTLRRKFMKGEIRIREDIAKVTTKNGLATVEVLVDDCDEGLTNKIAPAPEDFRELYYPHRSITIQVYPNQDTARMVHEYMEGQRTDRETRQAFGKAASLDIYLQKFNFGA